MKGQLTGPMSIGVTVEISSNGYRKILQRDGKLFPKINSTKKSWVIFIIVLKRMINKGMRHMSSCSIL